MNDTIFGIVCTFLVGILITKVLEKLERKP